ncbi:hypothetical protein [Rhizobium leguminosarum]|uniref:hypothetical protein n=1 Tax=Rhizobium leguminosarum TaxID=384 RepID=UPI003F99CCF3
MNANKQSDDVFPLVRKFKDIPEDKIADPKERDLLYRFGLSGGSDWEDLLRSKRILIISEAGVGKTHECQARCDILEAQGEAAFFLELAVLSGSDVRRLLSPAQRARLDAWQRSQSEVATFFLDSFDELKMTQGSFKQALLNLGNEIESQLDRVRIVVTARPIPFDLKLFREMLPIPEVAETIANAESFARIAMGEQKKELATVDAEAPSQPWRTVGLMPLTDKQIERFTEVQGVQDVHAFVNDLKRRNAEEFARRPQDLIEMCSDWNQRKRIGSYREQVEENIRIKLIPRDDRAELAQISAEECFEGASRLALAMVLTRRMTIRHNAASDDIQDSPPLDPAQVLTNWPVEKRRALLERALFGFASYGRVRFHHQSVLHYLAAQRLHAMRTHGMPFRALRRLLFSETRGNVIARPFMRTTACWLAIEEPQIFQILRDNEPGLLFDEGDPGSLTVGQRIQLLKGFVDRYGGVGSRGWSAPRVQLHRIASPDLAPVILALWTAGIKSPEVRVLILELVASGPVSGCIDLVANVAFDRRAGELERVLAVDGMMAANDSRLGEVAEGIANEADQWSEDLALGAAYRRFPSHMSVTQLVALLGRLSKRSRVVDEVAWQVPRLIEQANLSTAQLTDLRDGLAALISKGLRWQQEWPELISDRADLTSALAKVCLLSIDADRSDQLFKASVLALRLNGRNRHEEESERDLRRRLAELDAENNERLFWIEDAFLMSFRHTQDAWDRLSRMLFRYGDGPVTLRTDRDSAWVKRVLGDTSHELDERALMLEAALQLASPARDPSQALEIEVLIADSEALKATFAEYMQRVRQAASPNKFERKEAKRKKDADRQRAADFASWEKFWDDIANHPEDVFSLERQDGTAWDLWRAMSHDGERGRTEGWNRQFIEEHFDKATADRLRSTLSSVWRRVEPTLPSERPESERNTYLVRWQLGLAAIYAEAEDTDWARKLTNEDARRAARFAMIRLNGLPRWIDDLCRDQRAAVEDVLGPELGWELGHNSDERNDDLLQAIFHSSKAAAEVFLPQLAGWLDNGRDLQSVEDQKPLRAARVRRVVSIILKHGSAADVAHLLTIARDRVGRELPRIIDGIWLPTLMQLNPDEGIAALESRVAGVVVSKLSPAVEWFAALFGDRHEAVSLRRSDFTPALLLRLLRIAYTHVAISDDEYHEGSYSPDVRDHAERARNEIVGAIFDLKGEEGFAAKIEMSNDPLCAHFKDRILAAAEERWAHDLETEPLDQIQAASVDTKWEASPSNNAAMFELMVDRLADVEDLLRSDVSPRELWAGIRDEKLMRRELARALQDMANGLYLVDQESVTGDEKETDIRLKSAMSTYEAVIELKVGHDGWSGKFLRDTIGSQLLEKYLAPEHRKSGCLFVTVFDDKTWKHPDTGRNIDATQLEAMLEAEAKRLEQSLGGEVRLCAKVLDLRPRLQRI